MDELRDREMKRFNEEFERRLGEFHDLQNNILDRLGIASKEASEEAKKVAGQAAKKAGPAAKGKSAPTGARDAQSLQLSCSQAWRTRRLRWAAAVR